MKIKHETFTIVREIAACPSHVFSAWARPDFKRKWFMDGEDAEAAGKHSLEFRIGGRESASFIVKGGPAPGHHENITHYLEISEPELIVFAYTMAHERRIHSASLATVTLEDQNGGTRLTFTEQMTLIGASDGVAGRKAGWKALLDSLNSVLDDEKSR